MIYYMQKRLFQLVMKHRKFISRSMKSNQHEMVLQNESSQKSKSLIVRYDGVNKNLYQTNEVKTIRNDSSRILFLFNSNCFVLYKDTEQTVPFIDEVTTESEMPAIGFKDLFRWYAKTKDSGSKESRFRGDRVGRLDAANEAGFFHRTERSRLRELKKKLKDKGKGEPTEPKKTN